MERERIYLLTFISTLSHQQIKRAERWDEVLSIDVFLRPLRFWLWSLPFHTGEDRVPGDSRTVGAAKFLCVPQISESSGTGLWIWGNRSKQWWFLDRELHVIPHLPGQGLPAEPYSTVPEMWTCTMGSLSSAWAALFPPPFDSMPACSGRLAQGQCWETWENKKNLLSFP